MTQRKAVPPEVDTVGTNAREQGSTKAIIYAECTYEIPSWPQTGKCKYTVFPFLMSIP